MKPDQVLQHRPVVLSEAERAQYFEQGGKNGIRRAVREGRALGTGIKQFASRAGCRGGCYPQLPADSQPGERFESPALPRAYGSACPMPMIDGIGAGSHPYTFNGRGAAAGERRAVICER